MLSACGEAMKNTYYKGRYDAFGICKGCGHWDVPLTIVSPERFYCDDCLVSRSLALLRSPAIKELKGIKTQHPPTK